MLIKGRGVLRVSGFELRPSDLYLVGLVFTYYVVVLSLCARLSSAFAYAYVSCPLGFTFGPVVAFANLFTRLLPGTSLYARHQFT